MYIWDNMSADTPMKRAINKIAENDFTALGDAQALNPDGKLRLKSEIHTHDLDNLHLQSTAFADNIPKSHAKAKTQLRELK